MSDAILGYIGLPTTSRRASGPRRPSRAHEPMAARRPARPHDPRCRSRPGSGKRRCRKRGRSPRAGGLIVFVLVVGGGKVGYYLAS